MDKGIRPEAKIKNLAIEAGFDLAGISPPSIAQLDARNIEKFSALADRGDMRWYSRYLSIRMKPETIFAGTKSILVLGMRYRTPSHEIILANSRFKISRYALGRDYHRYLRKKGKKLLQMIQGHFPQATGRVCVDSAPVPEKILAEQAGIAFRGKHTNMIHTKTGSYMFLSAMFLNLELERDKPIAGRCGSCRLCIDACPTAALQEYRIDPHRCISYLTIEAKNRVEVEFSKRKDGWVFGCDVCQEVCPYNVLLKKLGRDDPHYAASEQFAPRAEILEGLEKLKKGNAPDVAMWERMRRGTALGRIDAAKFRDNLSSVGFQ